MKAQNPMYRGFYYSFRVIRGGDYDFYPRNLRASSRDDSSPSDRYSGGGFRLVRNK